MDTVTARYLEALDATANGPTHQDRSIGEADLAALVRDLSPAERGALLQHEEAEAS